MSRWGNQFTGIWLEGDTISIINEIMEARLKALAHQKIQDTGLMASSFLLFKASHIPRQLNTDADSRATLGAMFDFIWMYGDFSAPMYVLKHDHACLLEDEFCFKTLI